MPECSTQVFNGHSLWQMWDRWSRPYIARLVHKAKAERPHVPLTLYALGSGGLVERLGATGVDVVGLDYMIDMREARQRLGPSMAVQVTRPCDCLHARPAKLLPASTACLNTCRGQAG